MKTQNVTGPNKSDRNASLIMNPDVLIKSISAYNEDTLCNMLCIYVGLRCFNS